MNADILRGKWHQVKGRLKEEWGRLTHDDLERTLGSTERLAGILQEKYGLKRMEAQRQIEACLAPDQ